MSVFRSAFSLRTVAILAILFLMVAWSVAVFQSEPAAQDTPKTGEDVEPKEATAEPVDEDPEPVNDDDLVIDEDRLNDDNCYVEYADGTRERCDVAIRPEAEEEAAPVDDPTTEVDESAPNTTPLNADGTCPAGTVRFNDGCQEAPATTGAGESTTPTGSNPASTAPGGGAGGSTPSGPGGSAGGGNSGGGGGTPSGATGGGGAMAPAQKGTGLPVTSGGDDAQTKAALAAANAVGAAQWVNAAATEEVGEASEAIGVQAGYLLAGSFAILAGATVLLGMSRSRSK